MDEVLDALAQAERLDQPVAVATILASGGSAPRRTGTALLVGADGALHGSLNAGCVEAAVVERCDAVLLSGQPERLRFDADDTPGLAAPLCGDLEVLVRRVVPGGFSPQQRQALAARDRSVALVTVTAAPDRPELVARHLVIDDDGPMAAGEQAGLLGPFADGPTRQRLLAEPGLHRLTPPGPGGEAAALEVFVELTNPAPVLLLVGADAVAQPLATLGRVLGYRVVVCDPRSRFATSARFPDADEVVVAWPHRYLDAIDVTEDTAVCVLTHDARMDVPTLERALASDAAFVGAMGSRRTHRSRVERLSAAGVPAEAIARLRSPVGLDLQGNLPEEVAMSIAAELVSQRHGGTGRALSSLTGPLHRRPGLTVAS